MQHLAIEPVELVPIEAGTSFVDALEVEHLGGLRQGEALAHALGRRPAQQGHVVGQGAGGVAHAAEVAHRGDAIALGELAALLVEDQRGVGELRQRQPQGFVEQQLLGGVGDVVFTADHMGDGHGGVIDHHHEVVKRIADLIGWSAPGDHHVAAQVGSAPAHGAAHQVVPLDVAAVIDAEAHRGLASLGLIVGFLLGAEVAVAVVVTRRFLVGHLGLAHGVELLFRGVTAVGQPGIQQLLDRLAVLLHPLALDYGLGIPVDAQPAQTIEDVAGVFAFAALFVGVFNAQHKLAAMAPRVQPVEHRCACGADMKRSRWAGGQTNTHH